MATDKFEVSLKKLEDIVAKLEAGTLPLDASIKAFEEGVRHAAFCNERLVEAERTVEQLLRKRDGSFTTSALQIDPDDEE